MRTSVFGEGISSFGKSKGSGKLVNIKHQILIYGGLGNVCTERIIPALNSLSRQFRIEYAIVDLKETWPQKYYKYGAEPVHDYNVAIIATPNYAHAEIAIKALNSGLHILCEKPVAHTLESAQSILQAAREHPTLISMHGDHYVFKPVIRNVISNWKSYRELIGNISHVEAKIFEGDLQKGREWLFTRQISGGGIAMDNGIHMVSIMGKLFGFGDMVVTDARMTRRPGDIGNSETFAGITIRIKKMPVLIEVGKGMGKIEKRIVFRGDKAVLTANIETGQLLLDDKIVVPATKDDCYQALLREFLSAIEEQRPPGITLEDGYSSLAIIKKAYDVAMDIPAK